MGNHLRQSRSLRPWPELTTRMMIQRRLRLARKSWIQPSRRHRRGFVPVRRRSHRRVGA
jgi:hypothetical protein